MSTQNKRPKSEWQHPIPISLLRRHASGMSMMEIIEAETASILFRIKKQDPELFSASTIVPPIELIAEFLNIDITSSHNPSAFLASVKRVGTKYRVSQNTNRQHYFRRRFSLAHEIGHVVLSQLAGPLNYQELAQTKGSSYEEEAVCDLFASAILLPKSDIEVYLKQSDNITLTIINNIAKDFKVSRGVVLRRIAWLTNSILLLWDDVVNPFTEGSEKAERITQVYPNVTQLSRYFIPLYCTANDMRFNPNIILESFEQGISTYGEVSIRNLGSLPDGSYYLQNIFFQRWSDDLISDGLVDKPSQFFNLATFVKLS